MKRIACISVLALFAMLLVSALSVSAADTWHTDREAVEVDSFNADQVLPTNFSTMNIEIKEKDVGTPEINGHWTVNDSVNIDNDLGFEITNLTLNFTYASQAMQEPLANVTIASIPDGTDYTLYIEYQKKGPYFDEEDDIDGTTITIYAYEDLDGVLWEFDPTDYDEFSGLDSGDDLTIELDGDELDEGDYDDDPEEWYWDEDGELIIFEDLTIDEDEDENDFEFTWSSASGTTGTTDDDTYAPETGEDTSLTDGAEVDEEPFYMQNVAGVPMFIVIGVIVAIVVVLVVASKK